MGIFVTAEGFVKKTYEDHKAYYEGVFQDIFGEDVDLDPVGPIGQIVAHLSLRDSNLWEGAEEIYNSRNPNSTDGISLDNICAETGVKRQSEGKTIAYNVFLFGDLGTTITAGSLARESTNDLNYTLLADSVISLSTLRCAVLTIPAVSAGSYSVVIDGITYAYTATGTETAEEIWEEIQTLIEAGTFEGTITVDGDTATIDQLEQDFILTYSANMELDSTASGGDFEATAAGANPLPSGALNTIVTPITGWDSITNTAAGITGRLKEKDPELRIRRAATLLTGNATDEALRNRVLNNVDGVSSVAILSNRTDVTNADGLPPHSFEMVVVGGALADIANMIWITQPSGIASYGNQTQVVKDSQGVDQTVYFSRPVARYIWVKVQRDLYSEEEYPSNGDLQIKQNIVDWALDNQPVGKDVIRQRLNIPIYQVPGLKDVIIYLAVTASPLDTPTYALANISILIREYAAFDISRIVVEDIP